MKTIISLIIILCLTGYCSIQAQEQIVFEDHFETNANEWPEKDDNSVLLKVEYGKYIFEHKRSDRSWLSYKKMELDENRDFSIRTNTLWQSGIDNNSYDLLWGFLDSDNYYSFGISANGYYRILKWKDGNSYETVKWTQTEAVIKKGFNRLEIRKIGSIINYYINGNKVNQSTFEPFMGNKVGFVVYWNQKISFDDLVVSYIDNKNEMVDNKGPEIQILAPSIQDYGRLIETSKEIQIRGKATDAGGLYEVRINGSEVPVDENGYFEQNIRLAVGDNTIAIRASDVKNNSTNFTFFVERQSDNTTVESPVLTQIPINSSEKRLALIIGNSNYGTGSRLKNPVNDALLMSKTLEGLGFEVIKQTDANKQMMEQAIREFSRKLATCKVALFYYAGHGVQVDGTNYLIPVDAKLNDKLDCKFEAVAVNFVVEEFEKYPDNINIVILDACRNDPFRSWSRGGERGFKAINPTSGTIISYATAEGATASDGTGGNGLFTSELVKQMVIPQPIESVFKKTRVQVLKISNGTQSPQEWSQLTGDFYFAK